MVIAGTKPGLLSMKKAEPRRGQTRVKHSTEQHVHTSKAKNQESSSCRVEQPLCTTALLPYFKHLLTLAIIDPGTNAAGQRPSPRAVALRAHTQVQMCGESHIHDGRGGVVAQQVPRDGLPAQARPDLQRASRMQHISLPRARWAPGWACEQVPRFGACNRPCNADR